MFERLFSTLTGGSGGVPSGLDGGWGYGGYQNGYASHPSSPQLPKWANDILAPIHGVVVVASGLREAFSALQGFFGCPFGGASGGSLFGNGGSCPSPWGTGQPPLLPDVGPYYRTTPYGPSGGAVNFRGVAGPTSVDLSNVAPALPRHAFDGVTVAVDGVREWFDSRGYSGGFGIPSASVNHSGVVSLTVQQGSAWQQVITIGPGLTREQLLRSIDQQIRNDPRQNPAGLQGAPQGYPLPTPYGSMGGVQSSAPDVFPGVGSTWPSFTFRPPEPPRTPGGEALSQYFRQTAGLLPSANQPA